MTVDEWTDISQSKFMNVRNYDTERKSFGVYNLGLKDLKRKGTALNIYSCINAKLEEFGLSFQSHIVGLPVEPQLCINHAIHLAVVDTLYSNALAQNTNLEQSDCDSVDDYADKYDEIDISAELDLKIEIREVTLVCSNAVNCLTPQTTNNKNCKLMSFYKKKIKKSG